MEQRLVNTGLSAEVLENAFSGLEATMRIAEQAAQEMDEYVGWRQGSPPARPQALRPAHPSMATYDELTELERAVATALDQPDLASPPSVPGEIVDIDQAMAVFNQLDAVGGEGGESRPIAHGEDIVDIDQAMAVFAELDAKGLISPPAVPPRVASRLQELDEMEPGSSRRLTYLEWRKCVEVHARGVTALALAEKLGFARQTMYRYLKMTDAEARAKFRG